MTFEKINEPVEVIAHFDGKGINPLRFKWRDEVFKIHRIAHHWEQEQDHTKIVYFAVRTKNEDLFDLTFNSDNFVWTLVTAQRDE
jgi:hypothetical protein